MATKSNVSTGKPKAAGAIHRAPIGTTLPTDATTALVEAFKNLGYVSEDGFSVSEELNPIKAWGGDVVINNKTVTFSFTLIESLNSDVLAAVYNSSNVTVGNDGEIAVANTDAEPENAVWVIDQVLNGGRKKRIVIPSACISELGEVTYKDDEIIGYEVTLTANQQDDGKFNYEYISAPPTE